MEISTVVFEFLSFYKGDIGIHPFFVLLLAAFFIVKAVLARVYASPEEAVPRPQRNAEEEASLSQAKEAVRRKIAARKEAEETIYLELPKQAQQLATDLAQVLAPTSSPLPIRPSEMAPAKAQARGKESVSAAFQEMTRTPERKALTRGQRALLASLVFSRPKAL